MYHVKNLFFSYGEKKILKGVSLSLQKSKATSLIGRSGSGKSTLLKTIMGMLSPDLGESLIDPKHCYYLGQEETLLPWKTVFDHIKLMDTLQKKISNITEIESLLDAMGLLNKKDSYPSDLSFGMQKRVLLAQAIHSKKELLLLDEPFLGMDLFLKKRLFALLKDRQKKEGVTVFLVTHDLQEALCLSEEYYFLHEGNLMQKKIESLEDLIATYEEVTV